MENRIVTREEALNRIEENFNELEIAYGKVRISKKFFALCGVLGTVSAGIGIVGLATVGFVLAPITAAGLGIGAAVSSIFFYKDELNEEKRLDNHSIKNQAALHRIEEKAKIKVKQPE